MVVEIPFEPRPGQLAVYRRLKRFSVLVCHRRWGKTVLCINKLISSALKNQRDRPRFAYIAPLYKQAKTVAWDYLKHYTGVIPGTTFNESELRVDLPNGARIQLYGADNPDSLRGIYLDGVILDEYAQMNPKLWAEVIRPALSDRQGYAIFIGTPQGHNSFYDLYQRACEDPEWYGAMFKASETGILPPYELLAAKKDMTKDQYEQEFECSFEAAIAGAVYGEEMTLVREQDRLTKIAYEPKLLVNTAWDIGWDDSTAIIFYQYIGKEIRIIDYEEHFKAPPEFFYTLLLEKKYRYGTHWLPWDAFVHRIEGGGRSLAEQLGDLGIAGIDEVKKVDPIDGIMRARSLFTRFYFDTSNDRTKHLVECLTQYHYKYDEERRIYARTPDHDWSSHAADALRYLATSFEDLVPDMFSDKPSPLRRPRLG